MADLRGQAAFIFKGLNTNFVIAVFFVEDLDRDFPIKRSVPTDKNHAHAADGIALIQSVGAKLPFYVSFCRANGADSSLKRTKIGDVKKFPASPAGFVHVFFSGGIAHVQRPGLYD